MTWSKLDAVDVSEEHNPDVIDAISTVRSVLARLDLAYLDPAAVTVDADPEYRAVYFSIPHSDDGSVVELRHGDGYTYLLSTIGDYHGGVDDEELGAFLTAALTGRLVHTVRLRGRVAVEDRWAWQLPDDEWRRLDPAFRWSALWRLAWPPFSDVFDHRALDFNRSPSVVEALEQPLPL